VAKPSSFADAHEQAEVCVCVCVCVCAYLCTSFQEEASEARAASDQSLDSILGHLVAPGDVELLQVRTALARRTRVQEVSAQRRVIK